MKKLSIFIVAVLISTATLFSSFTTKNEISKNPPLNTVDEFEALVNYLESNGNFINSDAAPAIIGADELKKNMKNSKYLIVDIRSDTWHEYGHIKGAVNIQPADLLNYFETKINAQDYDKIVLVCYSGQSAGYFTSLLRLAGFDNAYSLKWGMSSWRADFAEKSWEKNISNDYADKLETTDNVKPEKGSHPVLNTGKTEGKDILRVRLEKAFATSYKEAIIKSADVFTTPGDYFTINYCAKDKYDQGHIPGAIQYQPRSLSVENDLYTLPTDKRIAVYGLTGQNTAYVVAYLDILGYDAGNVAYGANSFMNKQLKANKWDAFTKKSINMYPVVE